MYVKEKFGFNNNISAEFQSWNSLIITKYVQTTNGDSTPLLAKAVT